MKFKLKQILQHKQITIYQLSKQTGISDQLLNAYVHNKIKRPSFENVYKITKALNIQIEDLIEGEEYEK